MSKLAVGATLIALFTAAAVGGIWLRTRDGGGSPEAIPADVQPPSAFLPGGVPLPTPPPPVDVRPPPPLIVVTSEPRAEPPKGSWEAVPVVARPAALGPPGGAIGRGLIELQPRLAGCFDEDTAARFGPTPPTVAQDASMSETGATVLVLHVETGGGEARIVDAPVETQGGASDGVVTCAQNVLRGQRFALPQATPGGKYRLLHPLTR